MDILSSLGLGPPPVPGSLAPGGTFGAPAAGGGILDTITGAAGNPLLQMALSSYLGYIGSQRRLGRGAALANAGFSGLNAFNQAEERQSKAPLEQAQLQLAQAKIPEAQAQTQWWQTRTEQAGLLKQANKDLSGRFALAHPDPLGQAIAASVANSPKLQSFTDLEKAYGLARQNPARLQEIQANIEEKEAAAGLSQAREGLVPAQRAALQAETAERGTASTRNLAEARRADRAPVGRALDPNSVTRIYQSEYDKARASYLSTHKLPPPPSGISGYFADPAKRQADEDNLQSEADNYAHKQAGGAVEKLNFGGGEGDTATHKVTLKNGRVVPARLGPDGNYYPVPGGGSGG
jgi:hypothetical protein